MAKTGIPVSENSKSNRVTIRMDQGVYNQLIKYNEANSQTISETMLEAFELLMKKKGMKVTKA